MLNVKFSFKLIHLSSISNLFRLEIVQKKTTLPNLCILGKLDPSQRANHKKPIFCLNMLIESRADSE